MRWNAALTPIVLDCAARFGGGTNAPLIGVFCSDDTIDNNDALPLADWRRALVFRAGSSESDCRDAIAANSPSAFVMIGGSTQAGHDVAALARNQTIRRFAVASAGGLAKTLYDHAPLDYGGHDAKLSSAMNSEASYLLLMRQLLQAI
jgi:hypothetical protein